MKACRCTSSVDAKMLSNPFTGDKGDKCFGCSKTNEHGLHLEFAEDGDGVVCRWRHMRRSLREFVPLIFK